MDLLSIRMSTNGTRDACHEHHSGDMDLLGMRMSTAVTSDARHLYQSTSTCTACN